MAYAVLTRDEADVPPYAAALAALALEVIATPVTYTSPPADPDALRRALVSGGHDAVVVVSPRAVAELARAREAARVELPMVWAVGAATQRALLAARIVANHPPGVRDAVELARHVAGTRPRFVLAPRAEEGRDEALAILRDAGARVDDIVCYRTLPLPRTDLRLARGVALLVAGGAAVCAVFAPSQVAALGALLAGRGASLPRVRTAWIAIGETTATALREAGAAGVAVAAAPTPEGIANAVAAVYLSTS